MDNYNWLNKKTLRSVENLKLWPGNPRLNPEENHVRISDFIEDLINEDSEKTAFLDLIKSIVNDGFKPYDPIIVWQDKEDNKYYVAEGNRRVLALKLILEPNKAPKGIRATVRKYSQKINTETLKKIPVNIAPTFEEAEWYINQRNNASSLRRPWSRTQQQRWLLELYTKYGDDIDLLTSKTGYDTSELENFLRPFKIWDLVSDSEMLKYLNPEEMALAKSIKFPITILERFFQKQEARDKFKINYEGIHIKINGDKESFYYAFANLIERIINRDTKYKTSSTKIDTRTLTTNFDAILESLPNVSDEKPLVPTPIVAANNDSDLDIESDPLNLPNDNAPGPIDDTLPPLKNNPNRLNLVLNIYTLNTDKARLLGLFNEFKSIPLSRYPHVICSALRVFLDLAVLEYITTENHTEEIRKFYNNDIKDIPLKKRLEFIKNKINKQDIKNRIGTLTTTNQQFSLDVLNGFIHGQSTHYIDKQFLNKFWDFLFPIFEELLEIVEN